MDKALSKDHLQKIKRKRLTTGLFVVLLIIALLWAVKSLIKPSIRLSEVIIAEVKQGEMENTVSALGTVEPSSEIVLVSPLTGKIHQIIKENGTSVNAGEAILILDTEDADMEYQRLSEELKLKENNVTRLRLELEKNIRDIEIDDQVKELQLKNLEGQLSDAKRLLNVGGVTQEEVDKAAQNLKIAQLEKKKLENELKYRKESIASSVLNEQIQSSIHKKRLAELGKKLQNATLRAESAGVITWVDDRLGTRIQEGEPLVRLANLSSYSIMAQVSDMHADKISLGQQVQVEINETVELGEIEQILPAVEDNTIQFKVKLRQSDSEKLRPKMKVPLRIVTGSKGQSLYILNGSGIKGGKSQKIFVLENGNAVARTIELGFRTSDKVEVVSGLKAGDKVIISDMSVYENKSQLKLK